MPYKFTEAGNIVKGAGGHPVYIDDEDSTKEYEIDAPGAQKKINTITAESNDRRKKLGVANTALEAFGDLDPVVARKAIEDVGGMSDKGKADLEAQRVAINEGWVTKEKTWTDKEKGLNSDLFDATVGTQFATSAVVKTTVLPPDIAKATFSHNFKVNGEVHDDKGNRVYSQTNPGENPKFDEALTHLIGLRSDKDSILKATGSGGSGGHTGGDGGDGGGEGLTARENISAGLKARGVS